LLGSHASNRLSRSQAKKILLNCFCQYNESQWGPKQHWSQMTFIAWTKICIFVFHRKNSHTGLRISKR